ncbi:enoyl-CoA hydratase/isomerase family protein [Novosphingobium bradum]|uniref:3-hydroxyisobutyryl-CoA hydrolase n=1 Tax=Novosphingobium bradum TaxID=1737444 RepID=A0ABV7IQ78_9SPHN
MDEVLISVDGAAGRLSLNRPKAIHALNREMCLAMIAGVSRFVADPGVKAIVIDHAEGRGFCAGGDVAMIRQSALEDGGVAARAFFADEYRLNHQLFTCAKPVVAFMDGITMGGGVGLALPARLRVATQNTRLAMPEAAIGLFPDVGGGWYLSRLPHRVGQYLAIADTRIDGADCLWLGLATHYLAAEALPEARRRIAAGEEPQAVLDSLAVAPPPAKIAALAPQIERHFSHERVEDILASLAGDASDWAQATRATILEKCPMTCKVAMVQLARSLALTDFAENMAMEYRIGGRMIMRPDFPEGVRSVIIDKDRSPKWNPARLEDITEDAVDAIFAPLPAGEKWQPL